MEITSIKCICNGSRGTDCDYCGGMGYRLKYSPIGSPLKSKEVNPREILELQILIDWKHLFFRKYRNIMDKIRSNEAKPNIIKEFKPIFFAFIDQMIAVKHTSPKDVDKVLNADEKNCLNTLYKKLYIKPKLIAIKGETVVERLNERERKKRKK